MKKILFAAAALVAMASCSSEDIISRPMEPMIGFDTFVENSTRANDLTAENLANFGVYSSVVNSQGQQGMIFDNQEVKGSQGSYSYSPAQYWIANAEYDFVAFAPYADAAWTYAPVVAEGAETAVDAANGVITFNNETAAANQDFLFASAERNTSGADSYGAVNFTFNHMLSRVMFTFKNGTVEGNNLTFKVTEVELNNVHKSGTLAIANGEAGAWTVADDVEEFTRAYGNAGDAAIAAGGSAATTHYYLIPTNDTFTVDFKVTLYQAGVEIGTYDRTATFALNMTMGYSYNVVAVLNADTALEEPLEEIVFNVEGVNGWQPQENGEEKWNDVDATVNQPSDN